MEQGLGPGKKVHMRTLSPAYPNGQTASNHTYCKRWEAGGGIYLDTAGLPLMEKVDAGPIIILGYKRVRILNSQSITAASM